MSVQLLHIQDSTVLVGQSLLFISVPLYTTLLWSSDQPVEEVATYTTRNKRKRRTSIALARFEPATHASERPQTHAFDRAATGIGLCIVCCQLTEQVDLLLRHVSTANRSLLQGATSVEDM